MRASAPLTVVLPTPPLPATMSRRAWVQNPATSILMRRLLMILLTPGCLVPLLARAAAADPAPAHVDVVQVSGLIDRVEADFIGRSLATADRKGAQVLVLQL